MLFVNACQRDDAVSDNRRAFDVQGVIRGFAPDRSTVDIEHEAIPGYMPAMTMPFVLRDKEEARDLRVGDAVEFRFVVTENDSWIENVRAIAASEIALPSPTPQLEPTVASARVREGDALPDFALLDQSGARLAPADFRGKPLVLTFIFTRCPVPNFCPLMSQNFAELQRRIAAGELPRDTRLLSITIDPEFDTPAILQRYAESHGADPAIWKFATGEKAEIEKLTRAFAVHVAPEGGTLAHGLATAVIDAEGKIIAILRGNRWTIEEVAQALPSVAPAP